MRKIGERERMMILCDKETCGRRRVLKVETLQRLIDTRQKGRMDTNAPAASYPMRFVLYDTRLKLQIERKKERKKERGVQDETEHWRRRRSLSQLDPDAHDT
jgi:hypothetical protein